MSDFRAYYNTFYNARQAYEEATQGLEEWSGQVDESVYLSLFPGPERVTNEQALATAISKSADVLREHPTSKWVDDALMLIGKAYFFQGNFVGAEEKFREVLARPEATHAEARFWLARTLLEAGRYDEAAAFLQQALTGGQAPPRLRLLLGVLHVRRGAWAEAAAALERGLANIDGDRPAARAQFLRGQVYETMERYAQAAAAYEEAAAQAPRYAMRYAARAAALRTLGRAGRAEEALRRLRAMERDDKNADRRGELMLLQGRLYQMQGRVVAAREAYRALLQSDEVSAAATVRGRAHYALGTLYRDIYTDYVRAAAQFEQAAGLLASEAEDEVGHARRPPAAITDSRELAETFGALAEATRRVERLDSLLYLGSLDDEAFAAFVEELRRAKARERAAAQREQATAMTEEQRFGVPAGTGEGRRQLDLAANGGDAGFLSHRNPVRVQEARAAFFREWGRRPHVPNWRRINAISGSTGLTARGSPAVEAGVERAPGAGGAALPGAEFVEVDVSAVPRDSARRAAMRAERVRARYELGNALFLTAGRPDSAAVWYRQVIAEADTADVARRAQYALAQVARAKGDSALARARYRRIVEEYAGTPLAARARRWLRGPSAAPSLQASAEAEQAYARAYALWQQQRYAEAVEALIDVAARHRTAAAAPRALLAAGQAALEWIVSDTLGFRAALPVSLPDSLFEAEGLLASPDSLMAIDTLAARDTLTAVDSLAAPLATATDTLGSPDSLAAKPTGGLRAARDSMRADAPHRLRAATLFAGLVAFYPATPEAARARLVLPLLRERMTADSLHVDSTRTDSMPFSPPDSLLARVESIILRSEAHTPDTTAARSRPAGASGRYGDVPIDPQAGRWTIIVFSASQRDNAEAVAARYSQEGYHVDVVPARQGGARRYRVAVGAFAGKAAARAALREHAARFPPDSWLLRLPGERN